MTTIRARCTHCGDVHLPASQVIVRARVDRPEWAYRLRCPSCRLIIVRPTSARIAGLLIAASCPVETWTLPYRGPRVGPAITEQDVAKFLEVLTAHA